MAKDGAMDCIVTIMRASLYTMTLIVTLCIDPLLSHWVVSKMTFGIHQALTSVEDQMAMDGAMDSIATKMAKCWHGMTGIVAQ